LQFYHKIKKTSIKQIQTHTYTFTIFFSFFFFSYTLQIVQIQKLNKNYIKHFKNDKTVPKTPGIAGKGYVKPQGQPEQWWRVFSTRRREKRRKMGGSGSASSPFPFPAGGDLQSTQKTQQAVDFNFFLSCSRIYFFLLCFGSAFVSTDLLFFGFLLLLCFRRPDGWMCFYRRLCGCWCPIRRRWMRTKWSDHRLQLALLLQPAAAGVAVEMGEVAGGVDAEERTDRWVSVWWSAAVGKEMLEAAVHGG
jgi:hypothetical protein